MRHILGFIGITEFDFVIAERHYADEGALMRADAQADGLVQQLNGNHAIAN